jgi:signal transduction histidine kinase/ActR/RegA family two-component response regulator
MQNEAIMYIIDENHRILYQNPQFRELYPDVPCGVFCYKALRGCESVCDICPVLRNTQNDVEFNVDVLTAPIEWEGNPKCHAIIANSHAESDIADAWAKIGELEKVIDSLNDRNSQITSSMTNALAEAEIASMAKMSFLNNISHDIRTPMNAIVGFSELASLHLDKPDKLQDYLKKINQSSHHLLSIINDVLDMSSLDAGMVCIEEKAEKLSEIIHGIKSMVHTDIYSKNLKLYIDTVGVRDDDVYCDKVRLNQVLVHLLSNAIKFTKPGGAIYVRITQETSSPKGYASYEFKVKDNGVGMSPEFIPHIFEPFSKEYTSTDSGIPGAGLGMSITKNLVDLMGGTISVESEPGNGTEVTMTLKLRLHNENDEAEETDAAPSLNGRRILLAEDNDFNTEIAVELLTDAGFIVETAANGKLACEKLAASAPGYFDLILMDVQMPVMNGYEATRSIRSMTNETQSGIPIIAVTANALEDDRRRALEAGMNDLIAKPIDITKLFDIIRQNILA